MAEIAEFNHRQKINQRSARKKMRKDILFAKPHSASANYSISLQSLEKRANDVGWEEMDPCLSQSHLCESEHNKLGKNLNLACQFHCVCICYTIHTFHLLQALIESCITTPQTPTHTQDRVLIFKEDLLSEIAEKTQSDKLNKIATNELINVIETKDKLTVRFTNS